MSRTITINFPPERNYADSLIPKLRNFGETVWHYVKDNELGIADLEEIDRATTFFTVHRVKATKLRRLSKWLEDEASRQFLTITLNVS